LEHANASGTSVHQIVNSTLADMRKDLEPAEYERLWRSGIEGIVLASLRLAAETVRWTMPQKAEPRDATAI
jgi:hypothetical protein